LKTEKKTRKHKLGSKTEKTRNHLANNVKLLQIMLDSSNLEFTETQKQLT
jgi:hypothetical protein